MRKTTAALAVVIAMGMLGAGSTSSLAFSGQVVRAHANETWTRGSLAGSITWNDCGPSFCSWLPAATVQPSLPAYACDGTEVLDSDPATVPIWNGGRRTRNETASFDLTDVPIVAGVYGQRICLSVVETVRLRDPICVAQAPILGMDPNDCPLVDRIAQRPVTSALLTVPAAPPPTPPADPKPPVTEPPPAVPTPPASPPPAPAPERPAIERRLPGRAKAPLSCGTIAARRGGRLQVRVERGQTACGIALRAARTFLPNRGRGRQRFWLDGRRWNCANAHGVALRRGLVGRCSAGTTTVVIAVPAKKRS